MMPDDVYKETIADTTRRTLERVRACSPNYPGPGSDQLVWWLVNEASRAQYWCQFYEHQYNEMLVKNARLEVALAAIKHQIAEDVLQSVLSMYGVSDA